MEKTDNTQEAKQAARNYVESHEDPEVRRMYAHHWCSFLAGVAWQQSQADSELSRLSEINKRLSEINKELVELLEDARSIYFRSSSEETN